jgi:chromosome partitioning protein
MTYIALLNTKGGSGKTTLATNLAAWLARDGGGTAIVDYDPQGSATNWLRRRPVDRPFIHGIVGKSNEIRLVRVYRLAEGLGVRDVVVDTPAAVAAAQLIYFCRDIEKLVIPVTPSQIDIDVCARSVRDLHVHGGVKRGDGRLSVVANRVKRETISFRNLERFLAALDIPMVATIRDSQTYVSCASGGLGLADLPTAAQERDGGEWRSLVDWIRR